MIESPIDKLMGKWWILIILIKKFGKPGMCRRFVGEISKLVALIKIRDDNKLHIR